MNPQERLQLDKLIRANDVADNTLLPPMLSDCPDSILTDVAPKAPEDALNVKQLFTDAPIPDAEEAVFESTGQNSPETALETFKFAAVVANAEVLELPEVMAYPD